MTVTVYKSSDASAPVLTPQPGSLIALLDACLVNGYGSKAAAGWTKPYSGTNIASYKQGSGNNMYLQVDHSVGTNATVRGYEDMTGVSTGTGVFPQPGTAPVFGWWIHSSANTTATDWIVIATPTAFYIWMNYGQLGSVFTNSQLYFFGDITSFRGGDSFNTMIIGCITAGVSTLSIINDAVSASSSGHYMARSFTQMGSAILVGKHSDNVRCGVYLGIGALAYPNVVDGGCTMMPVYVHEPSNSTYPTRGIMPGLWALAHTRPFTHGDTFSGTGNLAGKTFINIAVYTQSGVVGAAVIETSNTW